MSRTSRKPRKAPRPSRQPFDTIHWRDYEGDNERSVCKAEERATYSGETVICSTDIREVNCGVCLVRAPVAAYHEGDAEDYKQIRQYPDAWMELSKRFKVGDKIRWLVRDIVSVPSDAPEAEPRELGFGMGPSKLRYLRADRAGMIGIVEKVNDGKRYYWPPRWHDDGEGTGNWLAESQGCLYVRFPGSNHFDADGEIQGIVVHPEREGIDWEVARG